MVATAIGTNTWAIRIGDGATDAAGSWAWYLKGKVSEIWDMGLIGNYNTGGDFSGSVSFGQFRWSCVIKDVVVKTKADMDKIKRAFREWNDSDKDLYFNNKIATVDNAYWAVADPWDTVTDKIRCRIAKIAWKELKTDGYIGDVYLMRVTDV